MAKDDDEDDLKKSQKEHASYFSESGDDETPETRFEPVEIDLSAPEAKGGKPSPDNAAEQLRAQLAQERQRTAYAQQQAQEQANRAALAEQQAMGASVGMINSALDAAQQQSANAEAKFQAALDAADHRVAAEAQRELTDIRHNLLRLQEQKAMVEADAQRRPPPQPRQQPQQPASLDQITHDLANSGFPRSADWLRSHPDWSSPERLRKVAAADNHLVDNRGYTRESPEYFAALEQELGMGQQRRAGGDYSSLERGARSAAPTSNGTPSLRNGQVASSGTVRLTPQQQEIAELSGMTNREYAAEFEAARQGGKLLGYR